MLIPMIGTYEQFIGFEHTCQNISESVTIKTDKTYASEFVWKLIEHDRNNYHLPKLIEVCPFCSVNLKASLTAFNPLEWLKTCEYPQGFTEKDRSAFERSLLGFYGLNRSRAIKVKNRDGEETYVTILEKDGDYLFGVERVVGTVSFSGYNQVDSDLIEKLVRKFAEDMALPDGIYKVVGSMYTRANLAPLRD